MCVLPFLQTAVRLTMSWFGAPVEPHLHIEKWPAAGGNEAMTAALDECDWSVWHLYPEQRDRGESPYMRVMCKIGGNDDIGLAYHLQVIEAEKTKKQQDE